MPINLPTTPACRDATPSTQEFGGLMGGTLGGPSQQVRRLGDRLQVLLNYPVLDADCADAFIAALQRARAEGQTIIANFPVQPLGVALGSPEVNGGAQTGTVLNIKGLSTGVKVAKGLAFSFATSTRTYLHLVTNGATADGSGHAAIHVAPMLRASPADSAALNFAAPQIEGFVVEQTKWTVSWLRWKGLSFTLAENA